VTNLIHLDTESTDLLIRKMHLTADQVFDLADLVYARMALTDWEGPAKDAFLDDLFRCTTAIKQLADELDLLGFQTAHEIEQWLRISQSFSV